MEAAPRRDLIGGSELLPSLRAPEKSAPQITIRLFERWLMISSVLVAAG